MAEFEKKISLASEKLRESAAIVIGAGAGLSAAAGLDYGRGCAGLPRMWRQYGCSCQEEPIFCTGRGMVCGG